METKDTKKDKKNITIDTSIEAELPHPKYITSFTKVNNSGTTHITLKIGLQDNYSQYSVIQESLLKHNLPINEINDISVWLNTVGKKYSGKSRETGSYTLSSAKLATKDERITLIAHSAYNNLGKLPELVRVVTEYIQSYENSKEKKEI